VRLLYFAVWCLFGPLFALLSVASKSLRYRWAERWAIRLPRVAPGAVWIHAASLGEGQAAAALFSLLRKQTGAVFLRTATSQAGLKNARGQEVLAALPMDAPWVVSRWLDRVRPRVLILVESELWPHLLMACEKRGIPVVVVNARIGRGQQRFSKWAPGLYARCQRAVVLWSCTHQQDARRLREQGFTVRVDGDLKQGAPVGPCPVDFVRPFLVAASTRKGDEERLLRAFGTLKRSATLVLAPRRLERVGSIVKFLESGALRWGLLSVQDQGKPLDLDVLVVDRFGLLPRFFEKAQGAFVGGTFDPKIGGHSPAESARWGLPIVRGPHHLAHESLWATIPHRVVGRDLPSDLLWALQAPRFDVETPGEHRVNWVQAMRPFLEGQTPPERSGHRPLLYPLAGLWAAVTAFRNRLWDWRSPKVPGCVISVGSLSAGGTGKTAVTLYLAQRLQAEGRKVAVLARGYKRGRGPGLRLADQRRDAAYLGDELAMVAARGIQVVSAPDRVAGAQLAFEQGAEVVLLDDGFQHRRLGRQLDVVVVDAQWPRGGGPMPVGSEREGPRSLRRANAVWVHGGDLPLEMARHLPEGIPRVVGEMTPLCWLSQGQIIPLETHRGKPVRAFAGIGRPGRFLQSLLDLGVEVVAWRAFSDHHVFTKKELVDLRTWAEQGLLVCTEKDLGRLPADFPVWVLRVEMRPVSGVEALFEAIEEVLAG